MTDVDVRIQLAGESVILLPERAVWWPDGDALLIADPHFGKPDTFRRAGVPVPKGVAARDLARLSGALDRTGAGRLIVLGDFYHARPDAKDASPVALRQWRDQHPDLELTVVIGNHDVHAGPPAAELQATAVAEGQHDGPFVWRHHPQPDERGYVLAGHIHPCVSPGRSRFAPGRVACFHFGERVGVLPAFGSFTGVHPMRVTAHDRAFAVTDESVVALSGRRRLTGS